MGGLSIKNDWILQKPDRLTAGVEQCFYSSALRGTIFCSYFIYHLYSMFTLILLFVNVMLY